MNMKRIWILFGLVLVVSFAVLGWVGTRIYQEMPPIPDQVISMGGTIVTDSGEMTAGPKPWQTMGGMEVGSVRGHGSYTAPAWTADDRHRKGVFFVGAVSLVVFVVGLKTDHSYWRTD